MATISDILINVTADTKGIRKGMDESRKAVDGFSKSAINSFKAIAGALAAAFTFNKLRSEFSKAIDDINKLSDQANNLGVSFQSFQRLEYMAKRSGMSVADVNMAMRRLQRTIDNALEGSSSAKSLFARLGLDPASLKRDNPEQQYTRVLDAMGKIRDQTELAALAYQMFSFSGIKHIGLIRQGVGELNKEFDNMGIALTDGQVESAKAFNDARDKLDALTTGIKQNVAANLASVFVVIIEHVEETIKGFGDVKAIALDSSIAIAEGIIVAVEAMNSLVRGVEYLKLGFNTLKFGAALVFKLIIDGAKEAAKIMDSLTRGFYNFLNFMSRGMLGTSNSTFFENMIGDTSALDDFVSGAAENAAKDMTRSMDELNNSTSAVVSNIERLIDKLNEARSGLGSISGAAGAASNSPMTSSDMMGKVLDYAYDNPDKLDVTIINEWNDEVLRGLVKSIAQDELKSTTNTQRRSTVK